MALQLPDASVVIAITGTEMEAPVVAAIIGDAALIVESCVAAYSGDRQEAIIKWVAAHLVANTDGSESLASEKLGDASETYARAPLGEALAGTQYGQQALLLDTNGCLRRIGKSTATVEVI